MKTGAGRIKKTNKQQHSLLFELENYKEILDDNDVERAVLTSMLNSSPTPYNRAGTEVQAAGVPEPAHSSAGHSWLSHGLSQCALKRYLT